MVDVRAPPSNGLGLDTPVAELAAANPASARRLAGDVHPMAHRIHAAALAGGGRGRGRGAARRGVVVVVGADDGEVDGDDDGGGDGDEWAQCRQLVMLMRRDNV